MVERWLDGYDGLKEVERAAGEFVEGTREKELSELLVGEERQQAVIVLATDAFHNIANAHLKAYNANLKAVKETLQEYYKVKNRRPEARELNFMLVAGAVHAYRLAYSSSSFDLEKNIKQLEDLFKTKEDEHKDVTFEDLRLEVPEFVVVNGVTHSLTEDRCVKAVDT